MLTVYGIETSSYAFLGIVVLRSCNSTYRLRYWNSATFLRPPNKPLVATVLTVYGIETGYRSQSCCLLGLVRCNSTYRLRYWNLFKPPNTWFVVPGCNSAYRLRYWNAAIAARITNVLFAFGCNSAYRLRYAPQGAGQQRSKATMRAAHRKYLSEVKVKRR